MSLALPDRDGSDLLTYHEPRDAKTSIFVELAGMLLARKLKATLGPSYNCSPPVHHIYRGCPERSEKDSMDGRTMPQIPLGGRGAYLTASIRRGKRRNDAGARFVPGNGTI